MIQYIIVSAVLSLLFGYSAFGKKHSRSLMLATLSFFVMIILDYCIMPAVNYNFPFILSWGFLCGILSIAVGTILEELKFRHFVLIIISSIYGLCLLGATIPFIHYDSYYDLMPVKTDSSTNVKGKFTAIPLEKMCVVDEDLAKKYAQAKLSNLNIGSICEIRDGREQMLTAKIVTSIVTETSQKDTVLYFDNEPIWVFPLEHKDFFKYMWYSQTPGYIIVSACREDDVNIITRLDGQDIALKYTESAFFNNDIERHIRLNGHIYTGLNDIDFEIDDRGYPYQVVTKYNKSIGFSGKMATGVIVVDAQSGDIKEYDIENTPNWIDRIQPKEFILQNVDYYGEYSRSVWASIFNKKGLKQATGSNSMIFDNGKCYWYNGVRSRKASDGTITGFVLTESRTMQSVYYEMPGIDESTASSIVAANTLNGTKVFPSAPLPYEVRGIPTYFMMLKTERNEFLGYAFVSVQKRGIYSLAQTRKEAEKLFVKAWIDKSGDIIEDDKVAEKSGLFTIKLKAVENNQYFFLMEEVPGREFSAFPSVSNELKYSDVLHKVNIKYSEGESGTNVISQFDDLSIELE